MKELSGIPSFAQELILELSALDLSVTSFELDHVCYRVEDEEDYHIKKRELLKVATLLVEKQIGGRMISTFKLNERIKITDEKSVQVVELPMPKKGSFYPRGWEHAEFAIGLNVDLKEFAMKFPLIKWDLSGLEKEINKEIKIQLKKQMNVKFHNLTLEKVIEMEE